MDGIAQLGNDAMNLLSVGMVALAAIVIWSGITGKWFGRG